MALVTIQRSPSPSNTPDTLSTDLGDGLDDSDSEQQSPNRAARSKPALKRLQKFINTIRFITRLRLSESYLAVKGAALILPQSECPRTITRASRGGDIGNHLQSMFYLLRPQDIIKVAIKLESIYTNRTRYLAMVTTQGRQDTEESVILGVDITNAVATIGLVLPIWGDISISLDGDGGFRIKTNSRNHVFKPVSVQAMWSSLQCLTKVRDIAIQNSYYPKGLTHTWVSYYEVRLESSQSHINEWNIMDDISSHREDRELNPITQDMEQKQNIIKENLKEIMMCVDLEEVTCKYVRTRLEERMQTNLADCKHFIDEQMIIIMQQLDSPSLIFPYLYLGSEWNASNLQELKANGVGYILNTTIEIDNFFPGMFKYKNVRVYDQPQSELLKHWDDTYRYISMARKSERKVLVHCKMGVSRSASTVIAFAMKEYGWSLDDTIQYVKERRNVVCPNEGFMSQLRTYQGILDASKQRHNKLWRSVSTGDIISAQDRNQQNEDDLDEISLPDDISGDDSKTSRRIHVQLFPCKDDTHIDSMHPRSWSPEDNTQQLLLKTQHLASDGESTDDDQSNIYTECQNVMSAGLEDLSSLPFTLDNCDDYEISSRSADSLDDAYSESPLVDTPYLDWGKSNILLLHYKPNLLDAQAECWHVSNDDSDVEDYLTEEDTRRREWGYYDVGMFAELDEDLQELKEHSEELDTYFLHPDEKVENIFAHQRKQLRIAQLLKLSQMKKEQDELKAQTVYSQDCSLKEDHKLQSAAALATKVRPDDYWIKDIPNPGEVEQEEESEVAGDNAGNIQENLITEDIIGDDQKEIEVEELQPKTSEIESSPESQRSTSADSDLELHDIGILQHYGKEEIPWHPGTVKRHKQNFEKVVESSNSSSSSGSRPSSPSSLPDNSVLQDPLPCTSCPSDVISDDNMTKEDCQPVTPPAIPCTTERYNRPLSIYETEEIELPAGLVQRTKQEIEERARSSSFAEMRTSVMDKPVQRSASWKTARNSTRSKDRNAERRKTCLPVLTPILPHSHKENARQSKSAGTSPEKDVTPMGVHMRSDDMAAALASLQQESLQENIDDSDVSVYKIGYDDVEMVEGTVKRHTLDFEQLSKEEVESLKQLAVPIRERDRAESPLAQEGILIRTGSVKRQKQVIEAKYCGEESPVPQSGVVTPPLTGSITPPIVVISTEQNNTPDRDTIIINTDNALKDSSTLDNTYSNNSEVLQGQDVIVKQFDSIVCTEMTEKQPDECEKDCTESAASRDSQSAYPHSEDIPWHVGTVMQHKQALENKVKLLESTPPSISLAAHTAVADTVLEEGKDNITRVDGDLMRSDSCHVLSDTSTAGVVKKLTKEVKGNNEPVEKSNCQKTPETPYEAKDSGTALASESSVVSDATSDSENRKSSVDLRDASDKEISNRSREEKVKSLVEMFEPKDNTDIHKKEHMTKRSLSESQLKLVEANTAMWSLGSGAETNLKTISMDVDNKNNSTESTDICASNVYEASSKSDANTITEGAKALSRKPSLPNLLLSEATSEVDESMSRPRSCTSPDSQSPRQQETKKLLNRAKSCTEINVISPVSSSDSAHHSKSKSFTSAGDGCYTFYQVEAETDLSEIPRKARKLHGRTHPLAKLSSDVTDNTSFK